LALDHRSVDIVFVPGAGEELLAIFVDRGRDHAFHDVAVVADRRRGQLRNMLDEFLHGTVTDLRQEAIFEEGMHPLVQSVSTRVDRSLFNWIAFAVSLLGGLLICLFASAAVNRVLGWGFRFLPAEKLVERVVKTIGEYRHNPGALAAALGLSIAANLSLIAVTALAIFLLHPASMTMKMCIIVPLGDVANSLPLTPGGLGVGEAAYNALFRVAGLEGGADALLCWRIWRATVGLIGLAFYLRGLGRTVKAANSY
jgi:hypothetical protein